MDTKQLTELLEDYKQGRIELAEALAANRDQGFADLGFAKVDTARERRRGFPEVVYGAGKTVEQTVAIMRTLYANNHGNILATRVGREVFEELREEMPAAVYHELPRLLTVCRQEPAEQGCVAVLCAGTSDLPVAEEAALTATAMGSHVERFYDVGVSGLHRLLAYSETIAQAKVLVVAAGMDGALPSVVGGLFDKPLIAVPTSVGYGANFGGLSALLSMLNSCAAGVTVVNIDNGFGAGVAAAMINRSGLS